MKQQPIWWENAYVPPFKTLQKNIDVEIAIVGAGITGLTAAYELAKSGIKYCVLDSAKVAGGVSGHTTGHLTTIMDMYYYHIIKDFSLEKAKDVYDAVLFSRKYIEKIVQLENIDCDLKKVPAYYYAEDEDQLKILKDELEAFDKIGIKYAQDNGFPLPFEALEFARIEGMAQFNAVKYLSGLARTIPNASEKIYEDSHVEEIKKQEGHYVLKTKKGSVTARKVILATHSPAGFNLIQTELLPYMSYVMAAELEEPLPEALFYDMKEPYNYIRTYKLNNKQYSIIGGFDHRTGQGDEADHHRQLEEYIRNHFRVRDIQYKWSAQVFEPADSIPYIGKSPQAENVYIATGFAGDGLIYGSLAGKILADTAMGIPNVYIDLFDPSRIKPVAAAKDFLKHNVEVAKDFVKGRMNTDVEDTDEIPPGEGAIVKINGDKFAVYRSEEGELHHLSPVCTHLKCIVQWNNDHKSWDCPCHGSRFQATGEVLSGPAMKALEKKKVKV